MSPCFTAEQFSLAALSSLAGAEVWVLFFSFSLQCLSIFNYFKVKTLVNAGKSTEICCYKCYHWVNKQSFYFYLLPLTDSLCDNIFYSYFLEKVLLKMFFLLLEKSFKFNASTQMFSGRCIWSNSTLSIHHIPLSLEAS